VPDVGGAALAVQVLARGSGAKIARLVRLLIMKVSPGLIEIVLHYHCCPEPHPRADAPYVLDSTAELLTAGLIERDARGIMRTTERGSAWVEMLCATPLPEHRWVDPRVAP
jgi:hypothetical protein